MTIFLSVCVIVVDTGDDAFIMDNIVHLVICFFSTELTILLCNYVSRQCRNKQLFSVQSIQCQICVQLSTQVP